MTFIETPIFTKLVQKLLSDVIYREIQQALILRPDAGKIIPNSGGLRKLRWKLSGRGKRGGVRTIYYWECKQDTIFMLFIYKKSEQEDLTKAQVKILKNIVKEYLQ